MVWSRYNYKLIKYILVLPFYKYLKAINLIMAFYFASCFSYTCIFIIVNYLHKITLLVHFI